MRILIDMSFIRPYELTKSIPVYGFRLLQGVPESEISNILILINGDLEDYFHKQFPKFHTISIRLHPICRIFNWRIKDWLFDIAFSWKIASTKFDIVLTLNELKSRTTFRTRKKKISIIHDLKDLAIKTGSEQARSERFYRKLIDSADIVVAISEYTKHAILNLYNVDADKIKVIYNSIKITEKSQKPQGFMERSPYILYVNTLLEYKNPLTLLQAFNTIKEEIEENLILVGKETDYWDIVLNPFIERHSLSNRITRLQNITEEELKFLYENASVFVSSSQHEGFGYTPIEAAIYCCPVICTRCEALPETTMMMLNYYEPADNYKELANKILCILKSPKNLQLLSAISAKYQQAYSLRTQATQFLSLIDDLLT